MNQTLEIYLKVSVGNDTYKLTKYDEIQLVDITDIKYPNKGYNLLPKWRIKKNKGNSSKVSNFLRSTKTNSPTPDSGSTTLPPFGNAFMYLETSSNNKGRNVFVFFDRTDFFQISNITFYYNRLSSSVRILRAMGGFRFGFLLEDNTWSTQYTKPKNNQNSDTSTDWTLLNLDFTEENYGIRLVYDQIDTPHADMCFINITITHSVY